MLLAIAVALPTGLSYYREHRLIQHVEALGGYVATEPGAPDWLRKLLGDESLQWCSQARFIAIDAPFNFDATLPLMASVRHLDGLDFQGTHLLDQDLRYLSEMTRLEELTLTGTEITDEGLQHLAALTKLRYLDLSKTRVGDAGLKALSGLKNLNALDLRETRIMGAGLRHLSGLASLSELSLDQTEVDDDGLRHLGRIANPSGREPVDGLTIRPTKRLPFRVKFPCTLTWHPSMPERRFGGSPRVGAIGVGTFRSGRPASFPERGVGGATDSAGPPLAVSSTRPRDCW